MPSNKLVIVAGLGEVGRPLYEILRRTYECVGVDVEPVEVDGRCSVLHICYPSQIPDFVGVTAGYIRKYQPEMTVIHSTLAPGTTRAVQELVDTPVVFSPVRGKHVKMEHDMQLYQKFVAGCTPSATRKAADHFAAAGFKVASFENPEIAELSKLIETTWLGVLVGFAQDVERMATSQGGTYASVNSFIQEVPFLPSHIFPGHIGGHCVMPNIAILQSRFSSKFLDAIVESNQMKSWELQSQKVESAVR